MGNITKALVLGLFITLYTTNTWSFTRYEDIHNKKIREVIFTGFLDYPPYGWTDTPNGVIRGKFHTIYQNMINQFQQENNLKISFKTNKKDYNSLVPAVRSGEIDVLLGAYFDTILYKGLDFVYPSILNNPITIFMLPERINEVKNLTDLQKLKGIRPQQEHYSEFVNEQLKTYKNLEIAPTSYEMFEKLFTGKVDYILISQYYGMIEASKLGLRNKISIARQTLWDMPLFIGVSKLSPNRRMIMQKLTAYSTNPENRKKIEQDLIELVNSIEKENQAVVPPTFGLEKLEEETIPETASPAPETPLP